MGVKYFEQVRSAVLEYIECWYNKKRRHKSLNNLNIDEFWNNMKYGTLLVVHVKFGSPKN